MRFEISTFVRPYSIFLLCVGLGLTCCSKAPKQQAAAVNNPGPPTSAEDSPLAGMPPVTDSADIYAADHAGNLSAAVRNVPSRIYVPNSGSNTVDVIDPKTFKVIDHFKVGRQPQHVTPAYDMKRLWVLNDLGDSVTEIDPVSGGKGRTLPVKDPYNMYFTPDGKFAIVVPSGKTVLIFATRKP